MMRHAIYLIICAMVTLSPAIAQAKIYRLACPPWPPYMSEHLKNGGLYHHILSESARLGGIEVKVITASWKQIKQDLAERQISGIACAVHDTSNTQHLIYTKTAYLTDMLAILTRTNRPPKNNEAIVNAPPSPLTDYAIGMVQDAPLISVLAQSHPALRLDHFFPNYITGMRLLATGKFEALLIGRQHGQYILKTQLAEYLPQLTFSHDLEKIAYHPAIASSHEPDAAHLIARLEAGFQLLRQNGQLSAIHEYHDQKDLSATVLTSPDR